MKIIVQARGDRISTDDLRQKVAEVLALLEAVEPPTRFARLSELAGVLATHIPHSYLDSPPSRQLAEWLRLIFDLFASRRQEMAVHLHAIGDRGRALLLTNCPDAPFLLDSVQAVLTTAGLRYQVVSHPILTVRRQRGEPVHLGDAGERGRRESLMIIELEKLPAGAGERLAEEVRRVLAAALQVERDRRALGRRLQELESLAEAQGCREFWHWLSQENFLPFAYHRLHLEKKGRGVSVFDDPELRLGLVQGLEGFGSGEAGLVAALPPALGERLLRRASVVVEEIDTPSPVHRPDRLVYLGLRQEDGAGAWTEHLFLGLFTRKSIDEPAFAVPALRHRIEAVLAALVIPKGCHDWRKTVEIFNSFPKVELFFLEPEALRQTVRSFTLLYRQGGVKVVAAPSLCVRGLTLLVLMPRHFYGDETRVRLETCLRRYFRSPSATLRVMHITADYLSLHVAVRPPGDEVHLDSERLENVLTRIARPWEERMQLLLERACGEERGAKLWQKYALAFARDYRTLIHPRFAIRDIARLEAMLDSGGEAFDLWGPFGCGEPYYRLQFYSPRESYLNELMPLLENLGFSVIDEVDFTIRTPDRPSFIKSFAVREPGSGRLYARRTLLLEALAALRRGEAENDALNALLLPTGLGWREIDVIRGYRNYALQLGYPFSKRRFAAALANNPQASILVFRYFEARFRPDARWADPLQREEEALSPLRQELLEAFETIADLHEDRILRTLFNLIDSTVRTSFFLRRERPDYFFAFKISALGIIEMPAPRPLFEIYVHAATMEGIHLRGGKVARGGIRWSDRPDDFRTEILGLMKTQMTKNAQIVPVGAKGGFVVKTPWRSRDEGMALATAAYQTLMRGLLDLTDNRVGGAVVQPPGIVTYDEPDPYLVVAADKGTAHLSDTANAISAEYGFWLGDAFASGGSRGYDHKELGITARGAWICVERHFREMGRDIRSESFTVVGIGDMSGDVFGNGMLLSRQVRLLAAFDHRHIFLDPDPDPETSWCERRRLFDLSRSSWDDYDRRLISAGGGVYPRDAKQIPLAEPVRRWLGVRHEALDGPGLIRLLLAAEVDLLWNGGIGTYVKASIEKHEEVGDRANDSVRIDAAQLRAKVVGEGGNLGFTQRARVEFARRGGRLNTDAVDNSAGVDCSDHEVNLKILMQRLLEAEAIASLDERDRHLTAVTEEVCAAVLADNYGQSLCLSLDLERSAVDAEPFLELTDRLTAAGLLDRLGECLPTARELLARPDRRFTRPELAILMAYSKMHMYQTLLESDLPEREGIHDYLLGYFPAPVRERFAAQIPGHPLAREIAATVIVNVVVNQAGSTFIHDLGRCTGTGPVQVVTAYLAFDRLLDGDRLRRQLCALDSRLPAARQYRLLCQVEEALTGLCSWALEHALELPLAEPAFTALQKKAQLFATGLGGVVGEVAWQESMTLTAALEQEGLEPGLARQLAILPFWEEFLPVTTLAAETGGDFDAVARSYHQLGEFFGIRELIRQMGQLSPRDHWDRLTGQALNKGYADVLYRLARSLWNESAGNLEVYVARRRQQVQIYRGLREGLRGHAPVNYHPFTVLLHTLEALLPG